VNALDASKAQAEREFVDVREDDEWQAGHIDGSRHIPLGALQGRLGELSKGRPIVAVCRSGSRSAAAVRGLRQLGYDAENLDGGVTAWAKAGFPLIDETGKPGRVI
jgi:rhodanese-related sulfurtransferase